MTLDEKRIFVRKYLENILTMMCRERNYERKNVVFKRSDEFIIMNIKNMKNEEIDSDSLEFLIFFVNSLGNKGVRFNCHRSKEIKKDLPFSEQAWDQTYDLVSIIFSIEEFYEKLHLQ